MCGKELCGKPETFPPGKSNLCGEFCMAHHCGEFCVVHRCGEFCVEQSCGEFCVVQSCGEPQKQMSVMNALWIHLCGSLK